eukprot:9484971-Pyramimonas_sp.AAC.1
MISGREERVIYKGSWLRGRNYCITYARVLLQRCEDCITYEELRLGSANTAECTRVYGFGSAKPK